eukprot:TRINITY_DN10780_c0_g1_i4.p1 TRINITY_DN10780_c0_g1~~TRINITY_DN10780_c0_g1_i4.p1  ORF type:complete len:252 (+),score=99.38 TRINITY_DN10780_c0_g1_i4:118-873(+)
MKYKEIIESLKEEIASLKKQLAKDNHPNNEGKTSLVKIEAELVVAKSIERESEVLKAIDNINEEIRRTKEVRRKRHEELVRDSEDVRRSLQFSQMSVLDDDSYLNKLSQELLNKYEKHHELKESIQELTELEEKNNATMQRYKDEMELLVQRKQAPNENAGALQEQIEDKINKIEELRRNSRMNEEIRKELEEALRENTRIQQKYLETVTKLQSHRKKDTLEMQIALKSLGVEKNRPSHPKPRNEEVIEIV